MTARGWPRRGHSCRSLLLFCRLLFPSLRCLRPRPRLLLLRPNSLLLLHDLFLLTIVLNVLQIDSLNLGVVRTPLRPSLFLLGLCRPGFQQIAPYGRVLNRFGIDADVSVDELFVCLPELASLPSELRFPALRAADAFLQLTIVSVRGVSWLRRCSFENRSLQGNAHHGDRDRTMLLMDRPERA